MCQLCENDISSNKNHCSVDLSLCDNIEEIPILPKHILNILSIGCMSLKKICKQKNVRHIECPDCENLEKIEPSQQLINLDISGCIKMSSINNISHKLLTLDCIGCISLEYIPCIQTLEQLSISHTNIKVIPNLPNLQTLYTVSCKFITKIQSFPKLQTLDCGECTNLEEIENMPNLSDLDCSYCPKITNIKCDDIFRLRCVMCENLEKIFCPTLRFLFCQANCKLVYIENIDKLKYIDFLGCKWLQIKNVEKVTYLQNVFRKFLKIKKLYRIIDEIAKVYYATGYKGFYLAEKNFERIKNEKK